MPSVKRSEQIKILREDHVSISIYRNTIDEKVYYDIVPCRLIYIRQSDGSRKRVWKRGANFKPEDIPKLMETGPEGYDLVTGWPVGK